MSEQDKIINRLEGDVELRDQNIAELCEDFTAALTAFRALSQQWRDEATEEAIWLVARTCTRHADDLDAVLVSLSGQQYTCRIKAGGSK